MNKANEQDIIQKLRNGDTSVLSELYKSYRGEFINYLTQNNKIDHDEAAECFQLSVIIFYENIINGKLTQLTSSLKSYLFQIGINKCKEILRKHTKVSYEMNDYLLNIEDSDSSEEDKKEKESKLEVIGKALKQLGEQCQELLISFYYKRMNNSLIAERLNYKNEDTVKNVKYKCLQQLKRIAQTQTY